VRVVDKIDKCTPYLLSLFTDDNNILTPQATLSTVRVRGPIVYIVTSWPVVCFVIYQLNYN